MWQAKETHLSLLDNCRGSSNSICVTFLDFCAALLGFSISIKPSTPALLLCTHTNTNSSYSARQTLRRLWSQEEKKKKNRLTQCFKYTSNILSWVWCDGKGVAVPGNFHHRCHLIQKPVASPLLCHSELHLQPALPLPVLATIHSHGYFLHYHTQIKNKKKKEKKLNNFT